MANPFDNPQMNESWMYANILSGIIPAKKDIQKVVVNKLNEPYMGVLPNIGGGQTMKRIDTGPLVVGKTMKTYTLSDGRIFKDYQDVMFDRKGGMKYGKIMNKNGNYFIVRDSQNPKKIYKVSEDDIEVDYGKYIGSVFAQPEEYISSDEEPEEFEHNGISYHLVDKIVGGRTKRFLVNATTRKPAPDIDWRTIEINRLKEQLKYTQITKEEKKKIDESLSFTKDWEQIKKERKKKKDVDGKVVLF